MGFMNVLSGIGKLVGNLMGGGLMGAQKNGGQQEKSGESEEAQGLGKLAENAKEGASETDAEKAGTQEEGAPPVAKAGEKTEEGGKGSGGLLESLLGAAGSIFKGGKGVFDKKRSTSQRVFSGLGMAGGLLSGIGSIFGHFGNKKAGNILGGLGGFMNMFGAFGGGEEEAQESSDPEEMKELEEKSAEAESSEKETEGAGTEGAGVETQEVEAGTEAETEKVVKEETPAGLETGGKSESAISEGGEATVVPQKEEAKPARSRRRSRRRRKKRRKHRRR